MNRENEVQKYLEIDSNTSNSFPAMLNIVYHPRIFFLSLLFRFGLYNTPFETELFDMEPPIPAKSSSMPVTYATVVTGEQTGASVTASNSVHSQETIDLRDLLTLPTHPTTELKVPSKLRALCANNNMKGLLEVLILRF